MKSAYRIASALVDTWPHSANVKSPHKTLLVMMIAEKLSEYRKEGFIAGVKAGLRNAKQGEKS